MEQGRFIVIVLDSYGVGYMDDVLEVRPRDYGANTCKHIIDKVSDLKLENLERLGLMNALGEDYGKMKMNPKAVFGRAKLMHHGGDTFLGHQEIMGTRPVKPLIAPFSYYIDRVFDELTKEGYKVEKVGKEVKYLWVNDCVAVGDNLETDLGQVYNVTTTFQKISFEEELKIAQIVRKIVEVERVIVFGGTEATIESIKAAAEEKEGKYIGINAPKSKVYEKGYMVRHLGYGIDPETQVPTILGKAGIPVVLVGKVADIVFNEQGKSFINLVDTSKIFDITLSEIDKMKKGFIAVNIQETDLAGHAENAERYAQILQISDKYIGKIIEKLNEKDILVITADHGNDPTIGHSQHTRENVPILIYKKRLEGINIGHRETMSDIGATVADYFKVEMPENGKSFLGILE
ncbi:phosphopentomutase [Pseudoleptotrichia goodfellowii]|uniref:Phosphopentomutase n=1 Tax=Pseudoleptotrichia goodfellowii TaxID=157692 RepID=A0A510JEC0_9FUSO|nr:phosphopentomutase [Pseudoleptotrichia goodfellowii]BBM36751.1 phosphopentomutase [Pseudoleptotrichia goodfellowii]